MKHIFSISFLFCFFSFTITAQISEENQKKVDQLFKSWASDSSPGVAIGIIQENKLIYAKGYGMANLENDIPITPESVFYMASVSKHFVTMCILLLEEQGLLDLDDEIQEYLPDFPKYHAPLTIRHFIHHTSGVRDYLTLWNLAGNDALNHAEEEDIYAMIKRQKELNFTPGERYLYSNSCYFMLAMIIEKVSGKSIKDFAEEHMFKPLGMKNTHFHNDHLHIIKNRVTSYAMGAGRFDNLAMRFDLVGSGGLYSCIKDLFLWDQNFYSNKLGKGGSSLIDKMHEEGLLNNGESTQYAFGLVNDQYNGLKTVSHGGAMAGYRTYYLRFPEQNFSVFVLSNLSLFNPGIMAERIADIFLEDQYSEEEDVGIQTGSKDQPTISLTSNELEQFEGFYWNINENYSRKIYLKNDTLRYRRSSVSETPLAPISKDRFFMVGIGSEVFVNFTTNDSDKKIMVVEVPNSEPTSFIEYQEMTYSPDMLVQFEGQYFSEELNVSYELKAKDGNLKLFWNGRENATLSSIKENTFTIGQNLTFDFELNDAGKIKGFLLDAGRVQNLKFIRQ